MSEDLTQLPDAETTIEISPWAVSQWIGLPPEDRPRLIDCREDDEVAICRIEGAEWLPLGSFPQALEALAIDRDRGVVVYCHHGIRSRRGAAFLRAHGVERAFSMSGGIALWADIIEPAMARY